MSENEQVNNVADRVATALASRHMSQSAFARATGLSPSYVSEVMRGRKAPSENFVQLAAVALGLNAGWLVGGDRQMSEAVNTYAQDTEISEAINSINSATARLTTLMVNAHRGPCHDLLAEVLADRPELADHIAGLLQGLRNRKV